MPTHRPSSIAQRRTALEALIVDWRAKDVYVTDRVAIAVEACVTLAKRSATLRVTVPADIATSCFSI
jgi:hypothetical protein